VTCRQTEQAFAFHQGIPHFAALFFPDTCQYEQQLLLYALHWKLFGELWAEELSLAPSCAALQHFSPAFPPG
jgi:hypothetical protein